MPLLGDFVDPLTGERVLLADGVETYAGESPSETLERAVRNMAKGLIPQVVQQEGQFIVQDAQGQKTSFATREEALMMVDALVTPEQRAALDAMLKSAEGSATPPPPAPGEVAPQTRPNQKVDQTLSPAGTALPEVAVQEIRERLYDQVQGQGLMPEIHEREGRFFVKDAEGAELAFPQKADAIEAAFAFMTPQQREKMMEDAFTSSRTNSANLTKISEYYTNEGDNQQAAISDIIPQEKVVSSTLEVSQQPPNSDSSNKTKGNSQHNKKWDTPKSVITFGHAFIKHSQNKTRDQIADRAASLGHQVGQFLDDKKAAKVLAQFIQEKSPLPGVHSIPIPNDLKARVILPDRATEVHADSILIVIDRDGQPTSSYPYNSKYPTQNEEFKKMKLQKALEGKKRLQERKKQKRKND